MMIIYMPIIVVTGQITDSNGERNIAVTATYIASISRSAVTNNTTGESGSV